MQAAWEALACVSGTIPKESLPSYIKIVRDAVSTARDKERRKRKVRQSSQQNIVSVIFSVMPNIRIVICV